MKKLFTNQLGAMRRRQIGTVCAFTLTELLAVIGTTAVLAAVLLSVSFTTRERVERAQCTDNLRQIAIGWNIYQQEFNQVMPCHWPGITSSGPAAAPWRTYEIYHVVPGTGQITIGDGADSPTAPSGPWNLGSLFATKLVPNPRVFYCPSLARIDSLYSYDYYATISNSWPSTPVRTGDDKIRTGYNYYPQLLGIAQIGPSLFAPKAAVTPSKWTELDTKKSIVTDLVFSTQTIPHLASGSIAGLNALFPDSRVVFQNARSNPQAFNSQLWGSTGFPNSIGENGANFRYVMSLWRP